MSNSTVPTLPDLRKQAAARKALTGQMIYVIALLILGLAVCWLIVSRVDRRDGHSQNSQRPSIILHDPSAQETA